MIRRFASLIFSVLALFTLGRTGPSDARMVSFNRGFGYGHGVALPGTDLSFQVVTFGANTFSVDVYRVDAKTFDQILDHRQTTTDFATPAVRHRIVTASGPGYYRRTPVTLPGLPIGLYAVVVNNQDKTATQSLDVTTLGIVTARTTPSEIVDFAVDLSTFKKRTDVVVERRDGQGAAVPVDRDGLARSTPLSQADGMIARGADGSIFFARANDPALAARVGTLQTDRPLYRPGDSVRYRAIERIGMAGAYAVPSDGADITISDPRGNKVFESKAASFNEFGTVNGSFDLSSDAALGAYVVRDGDTPLGGFTVEAYVKPEYDVDVKPVAAADVIAGDTARFTISSRYFFGKPAARMLFHCRAHYAPVSRWAYGHYPYLRFDRYVTNAEPHDAEDFTTDLIADANGRATIAVPTKRYGDGDEDGRLVVYVDARDRSGKTVSSRGTVAVSRAEVKVGLTLDRWFAARGDDVNVAVDVETIAGVSPAGVPVTLSFGNFNGEPDAGRDDEVSLITDAGGIARAHWHCDRAGYVRIVATARDTRGRETRATSYIWVSATKYGYSYRFDTASISAQKATYAPGETARLLITSPQADVDALVNVSGDGDSVTVVRHLAGNASTIDVPVPADAAHAIVSVWIPAPQGVLAAATRLDIRPTPHALAVKIHPAEPKYAPGDIARFAVDVRDERGRPVRSEIGLSVVDDALLALATPADNARAFDAFYTNTRDEPSATADWSLDDPIIVYTVYPPLRTIGTVRTRSASSAFQPGQTSDTFTVTVTEKNPSLQDLRTDFRDTAYWAPAVMTDVHGHADISFRWPDNLTSYTASGLAVTEATSIGNGTARALVSKDFLVRLATPRFMRTNDRARLVANVNGPSGSHDMLLRFSAPALGIADRTIRSSFDRDDSASAHFDVANGALGPAVLRLAGTSDRLSDGLERRLPIESDRVVAHLRSAGSLPADASFGLSLTDGALAGNLHIDLSPSVLAQLYASVHLLDVYPYACVEQTMSAALPLIDVERLAERSGLPPARGVDPNVVATHAIARLQKLQHSDGSWGWWEHDAANPYMTAYALYGLAELRKDGHAVPGDVLERGISSLKTQLNGNADTLGLWSGPSPDSLWNTRAFMFFALADAAPQEVDRAMLAAADAHADGMNPYALSALGLAHVMLDDRAGAIPLLRRLETIANDAGNFTYWTGGGWHYHWEDDPIETTAYALRFYHAMEPDAPRVRRAISWLRAQSHGSWWYTTKDTAAAIYALTEAIDPNRSEFAPNESIDVYANDALVKTIRITSPTPGESGFTVEIPSAKLTNGGQVRFVRRGTGSLYWSSDWTRYVRDGAPSESDISPADAVAFGADGGKQFDVTRTYMPEHAGPWKIGDEVDVSMTVESRTDAQFVAVEDPLPAGLEYQPRLHEAGDDWSGLQFCDDRVVFFASSVSAHVPLVFTYRLRASTAGTFTAPPPTAYAMYGPPVQAIGRARRVTIVP